MYPVTAHKLKFSLIPLSKRAFLSNIIKRPKEVDKKEQGNESIKIACGQIEGFKEMKGVVGVHLMAIEWEHKVPEIADRAKVLPRPQVE